MRALIFAFALLAGCTNPGAKPLNDPILQLLANDPAVRAAGSNGVLVYLSNDSGTPLAACQSGGCDPSRVIRLLVRVGHARSDFEKHGDKIATSGDFTYFRSTDHSVSPYGFLSLKRPEGAMIWIQCLFGDGEPIDTMSGEMQLRDSHFAQFSYKGDSEASHLSAASSVEMYVRQFGL
jgi:hypothetical protein